MIKFGTAGLRGIMGPGDDCINSTTITKATLAVSKFLRDPSRVAICYDYRMNSYEYAELTARLLASLGHSVSLFDKPEPSPLLAFTMSSDNFRFDLGIMITASHNTKEYNGYKVYSRQGYQLMPDDCHVIEVYMSEITREEIAYYLSTSQEARYSRLNTESLIRTYTEELSRCPFLFRSSINNLSIDYNPMHGVGFNMLPKVAKYFGYQVKVMEKYLPDNGRFANLPDPNPENHSSAFPPYDYLGGVILATDPDADRVRIAVLDEITDNHKIFDGHEIAVLIARYLTDRFSGKLSSKYVIKSLVTTKVVEKIFRSAGVEVKSVPVGFKYIGYDNSNSLPDLLIGMEETLGYQLNGFSNDKDGILISILMLNMVEYYYEQGLTLDKVLEDTKAKYGDFYTKECSVKMSDVNGLFSKIESAFLKFDGFSVKNHNYDQSYPHNTLEITHNEDKIYVRPSGTEPKIKFYYETSTPTKLAQLEKLIELLIGE